jgi:hypothetical protein
LPFFIKIAVIAGLTVYGKVGLTGKTLCKKRITFATCVPDKNN